MDFYTKMAETALRLIIDKGKAYTLIATSGRVFNPSTNSYNESVIKRKATVYGVLSNYKQNVVDNTNIKKNDKLLMVAAKGIPFEPTTEDEIIDGNSTWKIIDVSQAKPGNTILYYKLQLRR